MSGCCLCAWLYNYCFPWGCPLDFSWSLSTASYCLRNVIWHLCYPRCSIKPISCCLTYEIQLTSELRGSFYFAHLMFVVLSLCRWPSFIKRNSYFYLQEGRKCCDVYTMKLFKSLILIISVITWFSLSPAVLFSSPPGIVVALGILWGILPLWIGSCLFLAL